ncbi:MAG: 30S ribosomal protein S9 [Betaproteobacteria bacterium]|nr:30S ribosomal protein S9 [Betaproteobacteria bacterium]
MPVTKQPKDQVYATGRRKESVARVFMRPGSGAITVNRRKIEDYFVRETSLMIAKQALAEVEMGAEHDFLITVKGGGESGQAGAVRHGIARALALSNPELRKRLRSAKPDLIRRDDRATERKKVGLHGARRAQQYSKR